MFGLWHQARHNKENIFYAILTIFLLERVRTRWNRLESNRVNTPLSDGVDKKQKNLVTKAAFLYALPLLLPVVKYIYRSIHELSWSVPSLHVLESTWAFVAILLIVESFLAVVIYNLLGIYIERMNNALGLFSVIGRNIRDGSKLAVRVSGDAGSRVVGGARAVVTRSVAATSATIRTARNLTITTQRVLMGRRWLRSKRHASVAVQRGS